MIGEKNSWKKKRNHNQRFSSTQDQQGYYTSKLNSVGPSFANAIVRKTAYDSFAGKYLDPLVRENCRTYVSIIGRHSFKNFVYFYGFFEHDFTDAHKSHQILNLSDVHINIGQKQLTTRNW